MGTVIFGYLEEIGIVLLKLVLAVVLGGLVGLERQHKHRPAGLRTHILVCVGATLIMMTSQHILKNGFETDVTRLGAQIISGIGFLGAGTIIREGDRVRGLTTAATLWAIACVGIAIGIDYYIGAIVAAITMLLVLRLLGYIVSRHDKKGNITTHITTKNTTDAVAQVMNVVHKNCDEIKNMEFMKEENTIVISLTVDLSRGESYEDFSSELIAIEDVYRVE